MIWQKLTKYGRGGHQWAPGVRNPLKSLVMGPSLLVNCYLEIKFHKKIRGNPPPPLSERALKLAHSTHMGMTRTKQFIRSKLWWPGSDADVGEMVKICSVCLSVNPEGGEKLEPLRITPFPERPFSTVHIDLFGMLPSGKEKI